MSNAAIYAFAVHHLLLIDCATGGSTAYKLVDTSQQLN